MDDTVTVTRVTGRAFSEATGVYVDTSTTVYTGRARVRPNAADQQSDAGERTALARGYVVSIPIAQTAAQPGDVVTVTAAPWDAALVGVVMTVVGELRGTHVTARRLTCTEVTT